VLLYDLTSTYFESDPLWRGGQAPFLGTCAIIGPIVERWVIAIVVTPEGWQMRTYPPHPVQYLDTEGLGSL